MTNINIARSILQSCDAMNLNVATLRIDLEKVFDRVPHDLLLSFEHMNVYTYREFDQRRSAHGLHKMYVEIGNK